MDQKMPNPYILHSFHSYILGTPLVTVSPPTGKLIFLHQPSTQLLMPFPADQPLIHSSTHPPVLKLYPSKPAVRMSNSVLTKPIRVNPPRFPATGHLLPFALLCSCRTEAYMLAVHRTAPSQTLLDSRVAIIPGHFGILPFPHAKSPSWPVTSDQSPVTGCNHAKPD